MRNQSIAILMSTYNGQQFIAEQLKSIAQQTHVNWKIFLSDDGSSDDTLQIAEQFKQQWGLDVRSNNNLASGLKSRPRSCPYALVAK